MKRGIWIAEGLLGAIAVIDLFTGDGELAKMCLIAIAATMDKLVDNAQ